MESILKVPLHVTAASSTIFPEMKHMLSVVRANDKNRTEIHIEITYSNQKNRDMSIFNTLSCPDLYTQYVLVFDACTDMLLIHFVSSRMLGTPQPMPLKDVVVTVDGEVLEPNPKIFKVYHEQAAITCGKYEPSLFYVTQQDNAVHFVCQVKESDFSLTKERLTNRLKSLCDDVRGHVVLKRDFLVWKYTNLYKRTLTSEDLKKIESELKKM